MMNPSYVVKNYPPASFDLYLLTAVPLSQRLHQLTSGVRVGCMAIACLSEYDGSETKVAKVDVR